ncbi:hypothetical protein GCM10027046_12700 [Uliginosibacterium flavum]|uniref:Uncharacterized protein n=1 Tax=Uliginosibacterium flavum TaxID=1396831 RepID=A0ABV2TLA0_9RHOO
MRRLLVLCLLLLSLGVAAQEAPPRWQPSAEELAQLRTAVDARYARLFAQGVLRPGMSSIDASALALDALAAGYDPARSAQMLAALPALLDTDPASKTFGNIHWYQGDTKLVDRNGIEFVTRKAVLIWLLYAERLTPAQRESLLTLLNMAKVGIPRHGVAISYTNIWLMKTWNLIALGEALQDEALAASGYRMLADWLAHTRRTGINEYLSPSYYDVDLESLALICNLSRDAGARSQAREALDIFWQDIALNWYAPAQRLGGTHSRDYNRLFNVGGVNNWVARAGWMGGPESRTGRTSASRGPYDAYAWASPGRGAEEWLQGSFPRLVSARWGVEAEKRHTHFLGKNFSIASAESGYHAGHDNSPLVINLGSGQDVPIINFFMDGRRDYYGQNKTLEAGSGHMKALHLRPFLSSVQHDNEVLFLASVRDASPALSALESVVTLPADAEYWLDDKKLDLFTARSRWIYDFGPNGISTVIDVKQRDGRAELLLSDRDDKLGVGVSRIFPVQSGRTYRLAASLQGGEVFLYLNYLDGAKRLIGSEHAIKVSGGQGAFADRQFSHAAPEGAVWCKAWLYSTSSNRTELRVADLRFEELPADQGATRLLGGFDFREFVPQQNAIPAGATLFARREGAVAALRLLGAWDVQGAPVGFTLHNDGLAYGALRLSATHAAMRTEQRASLAMWASVQDGLVDETAFAEYRRRQIRVQGAATLQGDQLEASVRGGHPLRLMADVVAGKRLLREGMNLLPAEAALWVNGRIQANPYK